jgi:hypothetical protein
MKAASAISSGLPPRGYRKPAAFSRLVSFQVFLGALLVAAVFLNLWVRLAATAAAPTGVAHATFVEGDTYWHIAAGDRILATHTWPTTNYYSFTAPQSKWLAYEWLGEVVMAEASHLGGPRVLLGMLFALVSMILLGVYYYAWLRSGNAKAAFVACAVVLPLLAVCFSLRPQLLGYIFLLATLIALERYRQGRARQLWILPLIFLLWVNTHGTFVLGLIAIAVYSAAGLREFRVGGVEAVRWAPAQLRHIVIAGAASVLALLVNPYGINLLRYEIGAASQPVNMAYFQEWQPLSFSESFGEWFLVVLLAFMAAVVLGRLSLHADEISLIVIAVYMACVHQRLIVFFAIVIAPALALLLARWMEPYDPAKDHPWLNLALIAAFGALIAVAFPANARLEKLIQRTQPVRALAYLRQHPVAGPMFNDNFWGGYMIWSNPARKVFIDGRCDAYEPSGVLANYIKIISLDRSSLPLLERYGVSSCLLQRSAPLCNLLDATGKWRRAYEDDLSVIYVKRNLASPALEASTRR